MSGLTAVALAAALALAAPARGEESAASPSGAAQSSPVTPGPTVAGPAAPPSAVKASPPAPKRSAPFRVMLRSMVVPGWGQLYNRKYLKAGLVVAGEGYLVFRAYDEWQKELDATDRLGLAIDPGEIQSATDDRDRHMNQKVNFIWWAAVAHLLNGVDAYVDAHLSTFKADFGPPEIGFGADGEPRVALAFHTRF